MNYSFQYRLSRGETWGWIWLLWRIRLWKFAALPITVMLGISCVIALDVGPPGLSYSSVLVMGLVMFATMPLGSIAAFPALLRYSEIGLEASTEGLVIKCKDKNRSINWRDVLPIIEKDSVVVIVTKSGMTRPILRRAFQSDTQRLEFLRDASEWRAVAAGRSDARA